MNYKFLRKTAYAAAGLSLALVFSAGFKQGIYSNDAYAQTPDTSPTTATTYVCGPDVTKQVQDVIAEVRSNFSVWTAKQKDDACDALISYTSALEAWDIHELHNSEWILSYRSDCATKGAVPPCAASVQVGSGCHYAGSVNYVIWGTVFRLCSDYFTSIGSKTASKFTYSEMYRLFDKYKIDSSGKAKNYYPAREWTEAGWNGWPSAPTPSGDRGNCVPKCPKKYAGGPFRYCWKPHHDGGLCER